MNNEKSTLILNISGNTDDPEPFYDIEFLPGIRQTKIVDIYIGIGYLIRDIELAANRDGSGGRVPNHNELWTAIHAGYDEACDLYVLDPLEMPQ